MPHLPWIVRPQPTVQVQLHQYDGSGTKQEPSHEEGVGDEIDDVPEIFDILHDSIVP